MHGKELLNFDLRATRGFPKIRGTFLGGPYNKDYSILGSTLGSPYLGKLPQTPACRGYKGPSIPLKNTDEPVILPCIIPYITAL